MKLRKTNHSHAISCGNGNFVCYNTILNSPVVLNDECYEFLSQIEEGEINSNSFPEEDKELVKILLSSYLLLPAEETEESICDKANKGYLEELSNGRGLRFIDLRISELCNFGCKHCISAKARSNRLMAAEVAIKSLRHVMEFLLERQPEISEIDIHYGNAEPLINFPLIVEAQGFLNSAYPRIKKNVSINTNLSLLNEGMIDFFISEGVVVYTSLDGYKEGNDSIRVFRNGRGTFDTIWKKMMLLKKKGISLEGISVTLTDANFPFFDDLFPCWCADKGFTSVAMDFDLVNPLGIPVAERVEFLTSTWEQCNKLGIEFFGTWITPFLNVSNRSVAEKHYAFCKGIHGESVSISPDGTMFLCGSSSKPFGHYSDISSSFQEGGEAYGVVSSRLIGRNEICKGCIIEGACAGQCYVTSEHSINNMRDKCTYYRLLTERLLQLQGIIDAPL
jgi:radical SAM protein with 4Fe4S-binding SPASM domain